FRTNCSKSSPIATVYTPCTEQDQQNRVIKWKWGYTSKTKCEELRQQSQVYFNMTCCEVNFCNKQYDELATTTQKPNGTSDLHPKLLILFAMHLLVFVHILFS
ncbi:unnamed protein product, partial [Rotaria sp. Silwood2]